MEDPSPPQSSSRIIKLKGLFGLMIDTQDETVIRPSAMPFPHLQANPNFVEGVASRDVVISDDPSIWARIFLSEKASLARDKKLPIILYFHGGAFVLLSPDISFYHQYCEKVARKTNAMVISVDYRLIPEHRLPAAYEDAFVALSWLKTQATAANEFVDPWLATHADFSKVFLMGDSAGANIVHHLSLKVSSGEEPIDLKPLVIRGQILVQPMMGGPDRMRSEMVGAHNGDFSFQTNDWLWRLALPKGSDMSHPYCNLPAAALELGTVPLPPALAVLGGVDWMHDRQFEYVASLRKTKKEVELLDYEKAKHGFFIYDTEETSAFLKSLAGFITKRSQSKL